MVTSPASSLYEPQQFLITSGIYSSAASEFGNECWTTQSLESTRQESQSGRWNLLHLEGSRERLRSRNHLHFQLRVLCELIKSAGLITCNTKPSPLGGVWELKKGAKRLGARRPGEIPQGPTQKKGMLPDTGSITLTVERDT